MIREAFRLCVWCALLMGVASAQVNHTPHGEADATAKDKIAIALDRLKQGDLAGADIRLLARAGAVQAIPDLKKQFDLTQDPISKDSIASALVRLEDKNQGYWDYLVKGAADAIASDAPPPQRFDSNGKMLPGTSPEFIAWSKAHNLSSESADETVMLNFSKVAFLGETGDRRAIPLLGQALSSSNYLIQAVAASGLAELRDKASIPLIIDACQQAPADAAAAIARALVDFDDPQAQSAARTFRPGANGK